MIYPASYDIVVLQNATWYAKLRATQDRKKISSITLASSTPVFQLPCHKLQVGDKVVFTGDNSVACEIEHNAIYYVIAENFSDKQFKVSTSSGGNSIEVDELKSGDLYVAKPLNLSGYIVDSDIKDVTDGTVVASLTSVFTDEVNGEFELILTPETTVTLEPGSYPYDLSLTSSGGIRYYWLEGSVTVLKTISRN
jgi:hypothetical protein